MSIEPPSSLFISKHPDVITCSRNQHLYQLSGAQIKGSSRHGDMVIMAFIGTELQKGSCKPRKRSVTVTRHQLYDMYV